MPYHTTAPIDTRVEMFQKPQRRQTPDTFFNMKALAPRPISSATDFDTDFEDDDSIIEDDSPRLSLGSDTRRSETSISSFEEARTPSPGAQQNSSVFTFQMEDKKSIQGPRGPHLFRASVASTVLIESDDEDNHNLTMSPMTPRPSDAQRAAMFHQNIPRVPSVPPKIRLDAPKSVTPEPLDMSRISLWSPNQVARWMRDAGVESAIVEKFQENDISGAILMTLKFEDLRELDIPSFGQRTKLWSDIHILRGGSPAPQPPPPTPFEEDIDVSSPCVEFRPQAEFRRNPLPQNDQIETNQRLKRQASARRRQKKLLDVITPLESVSIVGIEQLMPKPHKCAKGENCSKWKKQQRLIENFKKDHPVSPEGGQILIAGDPGNPYTAPAVLDAVRPVSDAVPSVVASSDVLGPGPMPSFTQLEEAHLANIAKRDPQENVKQFLQFQHMNNSHPAWVPEEPITPPYEMFPPQPPKAGLAALPRLAIPPPRVATIAGPRSASAQATFSPYRMERADPINPELRNTPAIRAAAPSPDTAVYRFGTPFSEMDVPVTAIPLGPVARDCSQSVPPNMSYRDGPPISFQVPAPAPRSQSRVSNRRPSVQLPGIDENIATAPPTQTKFNPAQIQQPPQAYPWTPINDPSQRTADDIAHAGWMKKRKTRMLRHEWHEHHFTLKGTRLAMRKDERSLETLEYIDVDDYAIACSSLASGSKLNAAFKAMNISRGDKSKKDDAAFAFQLIPAQMEKGGMLRKKRESTSPVVAAAATAAPAQPSEGKDVTGKNKTHYFAVRSRDERIDWMRELMLAKALKQKSEGYEVNVNGNMI